MKSLRYSQRFYRRFFQPQGLVGFPVVVGESDLYILAEKDLTAPATEILVSTRQKLEAYILTHPEFLHSLVPVKVEEGVAQIVKDMAAAGQLAGVGPMAAVAGAIAETVGRHLLNFSGEVIVENGGDIFLKIRHQRRVKIYAGEEKTLDIIILPEKTPCGIATSSGQLGHSLSFGQADSVTILATSAALADAVATATGNQVKDFSGIRAALNFALSISGVWGAVIIVEGKAGIQGDVQIG